MQLYFIVPRNSGFTQDYLLFSSGGSRTFKRKHLKASSALLPLLFVHSTVPLFSSSLLIFLPNRSRGLRVLQAIKRFLHAFQAYVGLYTGNVVITNARYRQAPSIRQCLQHIYHIRVHIAKQNNIAIISTDRAEIIVRDSSEFILSRRYMYLLYMCVLRGRTTASVRLSLLYTCTVCNK